jgi:DNA transformation protein
MARRPRHTKAAAVTAGLNPDYVQELFTAFGPVSVRRMFSGAGVFADGLMIAIVNDGAIFLKAGPDGGAAFEREGCQPFHFAKKSGQVQLTSYWRMPDRLYDDPDELALWARAALAAAQTKASQKRRKA